MTDQIIQLVFIGLENDKTVASHLIDRGSVNCELNSRRFQTAFDRKCEV